MSEYGSAEVSEGDLIKTQYQIPIIEPDEYDRFETFDYWYRQKLPAVTYFKDTEFEINLQRGRMRNRREVYRNSIEQLREEPLHEYLKHLIIYDRVPMNDASGKFMPVFIERMDSDLTPMIDTVYKDRPERERKDHCKYWQDYFEELTYLALLDGIRDPKGRVTSEHVEKLLIHSESNPKLLGIVLELDERNKTSGESVDAFSRVATSLSGSLLLAESPNIEEKILWLNCMNSDAVKKATIEALLESTSTIQIERVLRRVTVVNGIETIRAGLREYAQKNAESQENIVFLFEYMSLDQGEEISYDLRADVYEKTDFSLYKSNIEALEFDLNFLEDETKKDDEILDIGCGTGRLLHGLKAKNKKVTGVDFVPKHIQEIKDFDPNADVVVGSWFNLPFKAGSFDTAYCLGRSFTHNTTFQGALRSLCEMNRILRDDGTLLIDLPDPSTGEYSQLIEDTAKAARKNGIKHIAGLINDSPDMEHYFDRLALTPTQFGALAQLAGFIPEVVKVKDFKDVHGNNNSNIYYKLTKGTPIQKYSIFAKLWLIDIVFSGAFKESQANYYRLLNKDPQPKLEV